MSLLWLIGSATNEEQDVTSQSFFGGLKELRSKQSSAYEQFIQKVRPNIFNKNHIEWAQFIANCTMLRL